MNNGDKRADLHTHTIASDGLQRPEDNVRMAREAGLAAIAITDHDTISGIPEAMEAGARLGILVVPGVELSTGVAGKDIHVLGYGFKLDDPEWLERLKSLRNVRNGRNERILALLDRLGMPVSMEELKTAAGADKSDRKGRSVGRPHIAQAMVDKGYVADLREAFDRWLGEGQPAYASPERIGPSEAIRWIHEAGGIAIVAHPGIYGNDELVLSLLDGEADGLEAYHSDHDSETESRYAEWAASRGKLITGGSDFHGVKDGIAYHGEIGNRSVDSAVAIRLLRGLQK
ncbi:PHP domain-containing protein [Cohnella endophytica]|uniref:PHP domain-containing protein n=1 Tax=Cohnella endophytica TaxID=2419778 RepID=A0A494XXY5_9BACL|nr:PHP domain-containing protein [Cohnella endophytica]RKP55362.1 PHP domain-containing protein [Cohnella endophytica]